MVWLFGGHLCSVTNPNKLTVLVSWTWGHHGISLFWFLAEVSGLFLTYPQEKESHHIWSHQGFSSVQLKGERHHVMNSGWQGERGMP